MKLRQVAASRGAGWVWDGLLLTSKQPMGFLSLMGLFMTLAMLLAGVPIVGPLVVVTAMPLAWMVFMRASQEALAGRKITPMLIVEVWRDPGGLKRWFRLGSAYLGATFVMVLVGGLFGPDMDDLAKAIESLDEAESLMSDPVVRASLLWRTALTLPVALAFWHTPALLYWGRQPVAQALFSSVLASWRNLGAFVLFGLAWGLVMIGSVVGLQAWQSAITIPLVNTIVAVLTGMWLAASFYASLYLTVTECIDLEAEGAAAATLSHSAE